ncbi:DMT family transporter [Roseovarius sp. LXJ103]|uniref:DMT family transporter n=1 Tax=Roseovarius carneus TaxID=2853164 RepID=UPI000D61D9F9|nr:DMT family transporter [Roseovarius carneus]MBZ8118124.1 DMT family transporter [Roseovarius carneus]PWE36141.1 EamA family transporter [Pelagicola sp. LXJ1103]
MRLFALTSLTMVAFAANSVLNRAALTLGSIDAVSFGIIRLAAGALILGALVYAMRGRVRLGGTGRWIGVCALLLYVFGFSLAYEALDAGLGALILFGVVQITMFAGSLVQREHMPLRRGVGAALAFGGLVWLLWPGTGPQISALHGGLMALAGIGWGVYSLAGRREGDALSGTAANFILAAPVALLAGALLPHGVLGEAAFSGIALAVLSGAVTSGLGYALWYHVLPGLAASSAAVAQLTVPIIAMAGGILFLGEALTRDFAVAALVVLGGVALSVLPGKASARRGGRSRET